ncbi:MAG TPA: hypothetical protein PK989_07325 [Anaerolineales bacterium]|nr:hypothetical protein [Anaerolineales bacterium]
MKLHKINLFLIFLITLTFYGYFIRPLDYNIASRLGLVKAVVEEGSFSIDKYHEGELFTLDKAYVNGHYYSDKAIGASLLGVLVYLPIYEISGQALPTDLFIMLVTMLAISLPTALLAPLIYALVLQVTQDKRHAVIVALCIALGTPIFPYAGSFYGHSLAALLAFAAFAIWIPVRQFDQPITIRLLFLSGLLIGLMVLAEYTSPLIAIFLIGYMAVVIKSKRTFWNWRSVLWFALGGLLPFILFASYNWICFGSPLSVGVAYESYADFQDTYEGGIMGFHWPNLKSLLYMTAHPLTGIFTVSPILFMALFGIIALYRNSKWQAELWTSLFIIIVNFLLVSGMKVWWGGDTFTIRYVIPVLPFFAMFLLFFPRKYDGLLLVLGILSFLPMLVASATPFRYFHLFILAANQQSMVVPWNTSVFVTELLPRFLHNQLTLTWGNYLFGIESWYLNVMIPTIIAGVLLLVYYTINKTYRSASEVIKPAPDPTSI